MNAYLENLDETIQKYFKILSNEGIVFVTPNMVIYKHIYN